MRIGGLLRRSVLAAVGTPKSVHSALSGTGKQQEQRDDPGHEVHYAPKTVASRVPRSDKKLERAPLHQTKITLALVELRRLRRLASPNQRRRFLQVRVKVAVHTIALWPAKTAVPRAKASQVA
jgi:hypothetical protein